MAQDCSKAGALLKAGLLTEARTEISEQLKSGDSGTVSELCGKAVEDLRDTFIARSEAAMRLGDLQTARSHYSNAVELDPEAAESQRIVETLRDAYLERGDVFRRLGDSTKAKEHYAAAIELAPHFPVALSNYQQILEADLLQSATTLSKFGLHAAALQKVKEVAGQGRVDSIPDELQHLTGGRWSWWREFRRDLWPRLQSPFELILLVLGIIAIVIVLLSLARKYIFGDAPLRIEEFDSSALQIALGKGLAGAVETHLRRLSQATTVDRLGVIKGPIKPVEYPAKLAAAVPSPNWWFELLNWVLSRLPDRTYSLRGQLLPSGVDGVGIALQLSRGGRSVGSETIWHRNFQASAAPTESSAGPYFDLAEPAATWLLFELLGQKKEPETVLGTADWMSYAFFLAGIKRTNPAAKRALYRRALRQDPGFLAAKVNLSQSLFRSHRSPNSSWARNQKVAAIQALEQTYWLLDRPSESAS